MSDNVNHPDHYNQGDIECIDVLIQLGIAKDFCRGNAIKYLWRYADKNGLEDLKKAQWYLNKLIELEASESVEPTHEELMQIDLTKVAEYGNRLNESKRFLDSIAEAAKKYEEAKEILSSLSEE